ncbi:MAG: rod shape-determining protein MreD [Candidatus Eisenbacteria bacterium]|nr:rod shape-determining protein MreD [Candidatus Eisenbacteria bacterium]
MKSLLALVSVIMVAMLLRSTALSALAARGLVLDVLTFATVIWALRHGETWGSSCGFVLGLAADLDAAHWLGRHALVLALMGYAVGRLSRTLVRDSARTQFVVLFTCTLLHQAWCAAFELGSAAGWMYSVERVLLAAIVSAPLGTLAVGLIRRIAGRPLFGHAVLDAGSSS